MGATFTEATLDEYKKYLFQIRDENPNIANLAIKLQQDDSDENFAAIMNNDNLTKREFIELIALVKQSIYNRFTGGAYKAAENETDRLYSKNPWKFVEEFLQNADDCNYSDTPQIFISIDEREESHVSIEFAYNEDGFEKVDIWAITDFSGSAKINELVQSQDEEGVFYKEKTGRKGKGFKSVFSLDAENVIVHIRSNGYSFRLDNSIGRILPIWEDDSDRMDDSTHVIVELVKPSFSVSDIYPEFRRLFCVDEIENIFANSPFLFMHRIKSVRIKRINDTGEDEFTTEYIEDAEKTEYYGAFSLNNEKRILAGIAHDGNYYEEQYQQGLIRTITEDDTSEIPIVRYTSMIEDEASYRNYSIIAPVITDSEEYNFESGALFRTFPMSLHKIDMPISIDAPYILNPDRSGVLYGAYKDDEGEQVSADIWNTDVTNNLFDNGVFERFMLWLRTLNGIRVDKYILSKDIRLFNDSNNSNGHGSEFIPIINISEKLRLLPLFQLFSDSSEYVSQDQAVMVKKELFQWPQVESFFQHAIGDTYKERILSEIYVGSELFKAVPIEKTGFVAAMNTYLDELENELGTSSDEMLSFVDDYLYPYLRDNYGSITNGDKDAFKKLCIYFSRIKIRNEVTIIREAVDANTRWFHCKNKNITSINRYRVFESSPVHLEIIKRVIDEDDEADVFHFVRDIESFFSEKNANINAKYCKNWDEIRDMIEAVCHFGYSFEKLSFPSLNKYILSENLDPIFNAFRIAGVLEVIPDTDVELLSEYIGGISETVQALKQMGLKKSDKYLVAEKDSSFLKFLKETITVLQSADCPHEVLEGIKSEKDKIGKTINATAGTLSVFKNNEEALLFFLNEDNAFFSTDIYANICDAFQNKEEYWDRNDIVAEELLIRVCAGATRPLKTKEARSLRIGIDNVLADGLENCIEVLVNKNKVGEVSVLPDTGFDLIPDEEILPLVSLLRPGEKHGGIQSYSGNLGSYGSKKKYITDGKGGHVYLQCDEAGDYKAALEKCLDTNFDVEALKYIDEMTQQFQDVRERVIVPLFNRTGHDISSTYDEIERRFDKYTNQEIISILSWFRYSGYTNALGNGNINNEKEIEDDYRNDPWKFIYEFIQNVDDCFFSQESPELKITIDGKANRIVFEYNEDGFTLDDVKSLTKFGDSNKVNALETVIKKDGVFDREKTGRKGRGFKSVFALPGKDIVVHICSNGFSFKFAKRLGSIIPIWESTDNAPAIGTRITVEGFDSNSSEMLMKRISGMFGVSNMADFTAKCPILYLRKLRSLVIDNGEDTFLLDITTIDEVYSQQSIVPSSEPKAGIVHDGNYVESLWERLNVCVTSESHVSSFDAGRYTRMLPLGRSYGIVSAFAPIIDGTTDIKFSKGALFRALPLSDHEISVPISINAPYATNSGRSAVEDKSSNDKVSTAICDQLLPGFFEYLREIGGIDIAKYVPSIKNELFLSYKTMRSINLQDVITSIPLLKAYGVDSYVSCKEAKVLPVECYSWDRPELLAHCFDTSGKKLVIGDYAESRVTRNGQISLNTLGFVEGINKYLFALEKISIESEVGLLREHVYPYFKDNYDEILKIYRAEGRDKELRNLKIYIFAMADGTLTREAYSSDVVWIKNAPSGCSSFGRYRSVETGSISGLCKDLPWMSGFSIVDCHKAFSDDSFDYSEVRDWDDARGVIEAAIYYEVECDVSIPFLRNCALDLSFDPVENIFRDAYIETQNNSILKHIIDHDDLLSICAAAGKDDDLDVQTVVDRIKNMGLRSPYDFFTRQAAGIYGLNITTLALLENYGTDSDNAKRVIALIDSALKQTINDDAYQLNIRYEEIGNCTDALFAKFFQHPIISSEPLKNVAGKFCTMREARETADYAEALLRALCIVDRIDYKCSCDIKLSDILDRELGVCVQTAKIRNIKNLDLRIIKDMAVEPYPSHEIDKALKWLDEDDALSISYKYYVMDLSSAFGVESNGDAAFVFDDSHVFLDEESADSSMLKFVQKRYKGQDESFKSLVAIIVEQNKLKGEWKDSKRKYIEKLSKFREDTLKQRKVLVPDYDKHINDANGKAIDYVLPELLQNINDCAYAEGTHQRNLNVSINLDEGTMLLQYDEAGFDYGNVYSITAFGQSSKHDESEGEKGLGFKKVFSLFEKVEIFSNGFFFELHADNNTVPKWIVDEEKVRKYDVYGKTAMLFSVNDAYKPKLVNIAEKWKSLMHGQYVGTLVSPIFMDKIDSITLEGCDEFYSREKMLDNFFFVRLPLLKSCREMIDGNAPGAVEEYKKTRDELKSRKKCLAMSEDEKKQYLDSLALEVCIPRVINDSNKGKGVFYSTLPTESRTYSTIFINVPLELTTGRDGIVDDSDFNKAVRRILFSTAFGTVPLFMRALEILADNNRGVFLLKYFSFDFKRFFEIFANEDALDNICSVFRDLKLFETYKQKKMVSINEAYSIDRIISKYIEFIPNPSQDVYEWFEQNCRKASGNMIVANTANSDSLERFVSFVGGRKDYFPITDEQKDLVIEFFKGEYGYTEVDDE